MGVIVLGIFLGLILGYSYVSWRHQKKSRLTEVEALVYLTSNELPALEAVMDRMLAANPFGARWISVHEGRLFRDVRLHVGLIKRAKSPHIFLPANLEVCHPVSELETTALSEAIAAVRIRFASAQPMPDHSHLRFVSHMISAYADLGHGVAVHDVTARQLRTYDDFRLQLSEAPSADGANAHVSVAWTTSREGGYAETHGLAKIGRSEWKTLPAPADQQILIPEVVARAVEQTWTAENVPAELEVSAFDDLFTLLVRQSRRDQDSVRILRKQLA